VAEIQTVDHVIPPGVWPDMREHGYAEDEFPAIYRESAEPPDIRLIAGRSGSGPSVRVSKPTGGGSSHKPVQEDHDFAV